MRQASALLVFALVSQAYSAPQFITWKDGKLGVNFGGYHAGIGIGGPGGSGGLYAEAGTPHGQQAMAGLGGAFGTKGGGYTGGLYAGAQAAENVHASAGLGGLTASNGFATGNGFATAQAGNQVASSSLGGQSSAAGSTGYKVQTFGIPATVVKETEVSVVPVENKPSYTENKKVHTEIKFDTDNEVNPVPLSSAAEAHVDAKVDVKAETPAVLVKEVYVESPPQVIEKTKIRTHYKPHHQVHKTTYIGGYVGGGADIAPPSFTPIQKRIDVGVEGSGNVGVVQTGSHEYGGQTRIIKEVRKEKNPAFFSDIFNIPISTLQAVSNLLTNSVPSAKVSVQKTASVEADSDTTSSKHAPLSSSSLSQQQQHSQISVETPSVSQIIDGIFSIPINTLGAVNQFLANNVPVRKRIQDQSSNEEPARARRGPIARWRANHAVYVQKENEEVKPDEEQ